MLNADQIPAIVQTQEQGARRLGAHLRLGGWELGRSQIVTEMVRVIDTRPCEPLLASDADWGEQDDGRGIPRKKLVNMAQFDPSTEGDR